MKTWTSRGNSFFYYKNCVFRAVLNMEYYGDNFRGGFHFNFTTNDSLTFENIRESKIANDYNSAIETAKKHVEDWIDAQELELERLSKLGITIKAEIG